MARRRKRQGGGLSAYFRGVFRERPQWLREKSNDLVLARYREDHGLAADQALDPSVRSNLATIKSKLRREGNAPARVRAAGRWGRGRQGPAAAGRATDRMTQLEEQIDDCLALAKHLDRTGLEPVIALLHRARNEVVCKTGQV
jgi:hypothetical protein